MIANKVFATPGKVAIYGWHRAVGRPIQPLYTGHTAAWVDYSHGVRLVRRRMMVNGRAKTVDEVLADPNLAGLLSREGVMTRTRYEPVAGRAGQARAAPGRALEVLRLDPGVRVVIDRPEPPASKPVLLVFYALPNGNTIEQTIGKAIGPGDDWHFDIQHIGAQTRFLREVDRRSRRSSSPTSRTTSRAGRPGGRKHGDGPIPAILKAVTDRFDAARDPGRPRRPQRGREPDLRLSQHASRRSPTGSSGSRSSTPTTRTRPTVTATSWRPG